jgi:hypothetical protein
MKKLLIKITRKWLEKQGFAISDKENQSLEIPSASNLSPVKQDMGEKLKTSFLFGIYRSSIEHVTVKAIFLKIIQLAFLVILLIYLPEIIQFLKVVSEMFELLYKKL